MRAIREVVVDHDGVDPGRLSRRPKRQRRHQYDEAEEPGHRCLPPVEQMRCFMPSHGFRAWIDGRSVAEMAICFTCNNGVVLRTEGSREWFKFDAESDVASSLSHTLSKYGPEPG